MDEFRHREHLVFQHCRNAQMFSDFATASAIATVLCLIPAAWVPGLLVTAALSAVTGLYFWVLRAREYRKANEAQEYLAEWTGGGNGRDAL